MQEDEERSRLHRRVRAFIEESSSGGVTAETFDVIARAITTYQAERVPAYARLLRASAVHPRDVDTVRSLPAVPTDAFRLARIAAHPPSDDVAIFRTSGTTGTSRGEHALSTTETYEAAAIAWGLWALGFDDGTPMRMVVLGPHAKMVPDSSLQFMQSLFAERFFPERASFLQDAPDVAIDPERVRAACEQAVRAGEPAIVTGTSFAFVHALDALAGDRIVLPLGSRAMHTGGFKGRSREVAPGELRRDIARAFGLDPSAIVGEYGMTELSSQLYEGTLRAASGPTMPHARAGLFIPPPWLRVVAADPATLRPLADGQTGILRFEDLANVDSAVAIQTADFGRCIDGGLELFGRAPGAPPRGCSMAIEELLGRS